jgi:transposase
VRQRVTRERHGRRGRKTAWANRRRLLRGRERVTDRQFAIMWNDLVNAEPSGQLLAAWIAKEELRALLACAAHGGVRSDIAHRLTRFYAWCATHDDIPELVTLAETVQAWWPQILGLLELNITNAGTGRRPRGVPFPQPRQPAPPVRFHCTRRHRAASASTRALPPQP